MGLPFVGRLVVCKDLFSAKQTLRSVLRDVSFAASIDLKPNRYQLECFRSDDLGTLFLPFSLPGPHLRVTSCILSALQHCYALLPSCHYQVPVE